MSTFTLDALKTAMEKLEEIAPIPIFASSAMFLNDAAHRWVDGRQEYVAAGPGYWAKVKEALPATSPGVAFNLDHIPIRDIDHPSNRALRDKVLASFLYAMGAPNGADSRA